MWHNCHVSGIFIDFIAMPSERGFDEVRKNLEGLISESVLLSVHAKEVMRLRIRDADRSELSEIGDILAEQKSFIIGYLKTQLWEGSLAEEVPALVHSMRSDYRRKLRAEEESFRETELAETEEGLAALCLLA